MTKLSMMVLFSCSVASEVDESGVSVYCQKVKQFGYHKQ